MVQHVRVLWAFWIACGLAAVAGSAPLLFAGPSSRVAGAIIPFAVAAVALGGCALLHQQGRPIATGLYFIAGLAIVYAILALIAVPLRLAVIGTCPPEPARCGIGFEQPLTSGESTGIGFAIGMGIVSVLTGFFGLVTLYRRSAPSRRVEPSSSPPVRRIAPVGSSAAAGTQERPVEPAAPAAPTAPPTSALETPAPEPAPQLELAAPVEELELPAHEEAPELPPPAEAAAPPIESAPTPKARRRRTAKPAPNPDPPAGTN